MSLARFARGRRERLKTTTPPLKIRGGRGGYEAARKYNPSRPPLKLRGGEKEE